MPDDELDLPDEVRDPFRASPYAVPLSTLVGGAHISLADQVQLQPADRHLDGGGGGSSALSGGGDD